MVKCASLIAPVHCSRTLTLHSVLVMPIIDRRAGLWCPCILHIFRLFVDLS